MSYGIGFILRFSVSAFQNNYNCHTQINLLLRAAISYSGGPFGLESQRVSNFENQYLGSQHYQSKSKFSLKMYLILAK